MNKLSDIYELFDQFENNRMSESEEKEFQQKLDSDDDFRKDYNQYHDIIIGIKAASELKLKESFKDLDKSISDPLIRSNTYYIYRIAALIIILLIGAAILLLNKYQKSDSDLLTDSPDELIEEIQNEINQEPKEDNVDNIIIEPDRNNSDFLLAMNLYDEYYTRYPNNLVAHSRGIPTDSLELAMYYYQLDDYENCLVIIGNLMLNNPDDNDLLFYSAICLMNNQEFDKALLNFDMISKSDALAYTDEIKWYTALIYLRTKQINQALNILNYLSSYTNDYKNSSESIVSALSEKKN